MNVCTISPIEFSFSCISQLSSPSLFSKAFKFFRIILYAIFVLLRKHISPQLKYKARIRIFFYHFYKIYNKNLCEIICAYITYFNKYQKKTRNIKSGGEKLNLFPRFVCCFNEWE